MLSTINRGRVESYPEIGILSPELARLTLTLTDQWVMAPNYFSIPRRAMPGKLP